MVAKKRFQANGFWLFALVRKEMNEDKGSFKDYVEVADTYWKEMSEDQKLFWRGLALGFRQTTLFGEMKVVHKKLQNSYTEAEVKAMKALWVKHQRMLGRWFVINIREAFDECHSM